MQRPLHTRHIRVPGSRVQLSEQLPHQRDVEFNTTSLLQHLISEFAHAALAHKYFEAAQDRAEWRKIGPSLDPNTRHVESDTPDILIAKTSERHRLRQERRDEIDDFHSILFAKSFIFSLEHFEATHAALENIHPDIVHLSGIKDRFPDLTGIRNTLHHMKDRLQDIGTRKGRQIPRVGGENPILPYTGAGRMFLYGVQDGSIFFCTMGDGKVGQLDINYDSIDFLFGILGSTINSFNWTGSDYQVSLP